MARKMKKFSAGGAQGRYDRRMADIEKDYQNAMKRKTGKAAEVAEAKRQQRITDAKDDLAKRTGADRTATRAAESAAERNLTLTRKFGAPQAVVKDTGPVAKVTESLSLPKMDSSIGKPVVKPKVNKPKVVSTPKPDTPKVNYPKVDFGKPATPTKPVAEATAPKPKSPINAGRSPGFLAGMFSGSNKAFEESQAKKYGRRTPLISGTDPKATIKFGDAVRNDPARKAKLADMKRAAEAPGASAWAKGRYKDAVSSGMYAKGGAVKKKGKTMKYAKGGSTPPQPTPADRARSKKHLDELKKLKPTDKEGKVVASANRSEGPGYKKGGKAMPFAATKFGKALVKKSADTKGRAMVKKAGGGKCYAKGGSIDGIAKKGKTKGKMV